MLQSGDAHGDDRDDVLFWFDHPDGRDDIGSMYGYTNDTASAGAWSYASAHFINRHNS
ncbi:hypothetical protein AB0M64_03570 [Streptomyces sp. NPDC051771]|uniref:hypothetical protein n=1 Tax=Streptomyces sp. NPDC051771 TaxID=3154847 RepID=UPI00341622C6